MEVAFALVVVIVIILAIMPGIISSRISKRREEEKLKAIKEFNQKVIDEIEGKGFNITKTFYLKAQKSGNEKFEQQMVCVDGKNKKLVFIDYSKKDYVIIDYKDYVTYKLFENNGVNVETNTDFFFDVPITTTSSKNVCKKLKLVIVINDEENTNVVYDLIQSSVSIDSSSYKALVNSVIELTSFLEVINKNTPKSQKFYYCKYCGVKNAENASHCVSCGSVLKD